jgi:hypothetical protein
MIEATNARDYLEKKISPPQVTDAQKRTKACCVQIEARLKSGGTVRSVAGGGESRG